MTSYPILIGTSDENIEPIAAPPDDSHLNLLIQVLEAQGLDRPLPRGGDRPWNLRSGRWRAPEDRPASLRGVAEQGSTDTTAGLRTA
jgi:hypothetical protein